VRGRVGAAIAIVAAYLVGCDAFAGSDGAGARLLIFSGTDFWRNGGFLHGGVLWAPDGLDQDGFRFKGLLSGGYYQYQSGALGDAPIQGRETLALLMPGWRFKRGTTEVSVFAGLDLENHRLSPDDPSSALRGSDVGLRFAANIWTEPTPGSMAAADASISTIARSYSVHGAIGWRLADLFYLGPELASFASGDYRQDRVGIHVTALHFGDTEWSAAAGWARDSDRRAGAYVRVGISARR
jgi:hypothetical protein